mmetsp:Transcript_25585/g.81409  ORF Transcript_25585/g.81409 Transcript_25585/m.81409 type:complete len:259 (+) Transcript_25585:3-779(+)
MNEVECSGAADEAIAQVFPGELVSVISYTSGRVGIIVGRDESCKVSKLPQSRFDAQVEVVECGPEGCAVGLKNGQVYVISKSGKIAVLVRQPRHEIVQLGATAFTDNYAALKDNGSLMLRGDSLSRQGKRSVAQYVPQMETFVVLFQSGKIEIVSPGPLTSAEADFVAQVNAGTALELHQGCPLGVAVRMDDDTVIVKIAGMLGEEMPGKSLYSFNNVARVETTYVAILIVFQDGSATMFTLSHWSTAQKVCVTGPTI